jgi:hypothetical protein
MRGLKSIDRGWLRKPETCTPPGVTILPVGTDWGKTEAPAAEDHWAAKVVLGNQVDRWPIGEGPNAKQAPPSSQATNSAKTPPPSQASTPPKDNRPIRGFHPGKKGKPGHRDLP